MKRITVIPVLLLALIGLVYPTSIVGPETKLLKDSGLHLESNVGFVPYSKQYDAIGEDWEQFGSDSSKSEMFSVNKLYFGLTKEFTIGGKVYYRRREQDFVDTLSGTQQGLGDSEVRFVYRAVRGETEGEGTTLISGLRIPTGNTENFPPLGDGSWDFMLGFNTSKKLLIFHGQMLGGLWINGLNGDNYEGTALGNQLFFNFNAEIRARSKVDSSEVFSVVGEASGYFGTGEEGKKFIELSAGPQWHVLDNLVLQAAARIPVSSNEKYGHSYSLYGGLYLDI